MNGNSHFQRGGIYRSRRGWVLGVCRGIADYFDFSIFWVRFLTLLLLLITGIWPVAGIYLLAGVLMKPEPIIPFASDHEQEFYDSYTHAPHRASQRLRKRYENLERRIRRMEDVVTAREFDFDDRLNR